MVSGIKMEKDLKVNGLREKGMDREFLLMLKVRDLG